MVKAGERYRHFKGGEYEVVAVARNCDNAEQMVVVYRALYGDGETWVRLLEEFDGFREKGVIRIIKMDRVKCSGLDTSGYSITIWEKI